MSENQSIIVKPWYKHGWPWVFISISVLTLVVSFGFMWLAIHNKDSEVRDDWYRDGKAINQEFARDDYATALTMNARLSFTPTEVTVRIGGRYAIPAEALPAELSLNFSHPTNAGRDALVRLAKQADGSYKAAMPRPLSGRYYIELGCPNWRLQADNIFPRDSLEMDAKPPRA